MHGVFPSFRDTFSVLETWNEVSFEGLCLQKAGVSAASGERAGRWALGAQPVAGWLF